MRSILERFTAGSMFTKRILLRNNSAKLAGVIVIITILMLSAAPFNQVYASHSFAASSNLSNSNGVASTTPQVKASGSDVYSVWLEGSNVFFANSTDTGATFDAAINLSNTGTATVPFLATAGNNVYAAWVEGGTEISLIRSKDDGKTFPDPVIDISGLVGAFAFGPQITASGSNAYVVWADFPAAGTEIFFSRSTNNGDVFSAPLSLSPAAPSAQEPQISVSGNDVYVVWRDNNNIFFINSTDNGGTFPDPAINLSNSVSTSRTPEVAAAGGNVYVVWREGSNIFFVRSTDNGDTFEAPVDIGDTGGSSSALPQIVASGNDVYLVWRETISAKGDIMFRSSVDGGAAFSPAIGNAATNLSGNSGESGLPQISVSGSLVSVVWRDDSSMNYEILSRVSHDKGATFDNSISVSNNAGSSGNPQLASDGDNVFVVWDDDTTDASKDALFSVGTPAAISVQFDKATEYKIGETATITVTDAASNMDDLTAENIVASIASTEDPIGITLTLTETGPATGIFSKTVLFLASNSVDEVSIEVEAGDTVTATFSGINGTATVFPISIDFKFKGFSVVAYDFGHIGNIFVTDQNSNLDPGVAEVITVSVTSNIDPIGISMDLVETGLNTGVFGGTSSQLIFIENDGELLPDSGTITLTHESDPANVDPAAIDFTTLTITSTSEPLPGIILNITETGVDTAVFTGEITLTTGASVPGTSIKVAGGDILVITVNPNLEKTSLIVPNPNFSVGALTVDFVNNDTATVTYHGQIGTVDVNDGGGAGGGGGGLIRPGLVLNVVAGTSLFGGGSRGGTETPTVTSSTLTFDTTPTFTQLEEGDEFGGIINQKDLDKSETQSIQVGKEVEFSFDLFENGGIGNVQHVALYLNMRGEKFTYADSDTYIMFDSGKPVKIVDPHGYFDKAEFSILEKDAFNLSLKYKITFAELMEKSHILLRVWDFDKRNSDVIHLNAIEVVKGEKDLSSFEGTDLLKDEVSLPSKQSLDEPDSLERARKELLVGENVPAWIKTSAGWWSEKRISDSDFVLGIEYLIQQKVIEVPSSETTKTVQKIPQWVSTIAGSWSEEIISDSEFVAALQWLIENGVVKV